MSAKLTGSFEVMSVIAAFYRAESYAGKAERTRGRLFSEPGSQSSGADSTFATLLPRLPQANVKSKAPLVSIICQWSSDSDIRKKRLPRWVANVRIGLLGCACSHLRDRRDLR